MTSPLQRMVACGDEFAVASPLSPTLPSLCLDEWTEAVDGAFVPLETTILDRDRFAGHLVGSSLGDLKLTYVGGSAVTVSRTVRTIRRADRGYLKVGVQMRGYCVLAQDGREAAMTPGDLSVYDTSRPYSLVFDNDFEMLVLMLPRERLTLRSRQVADLTARRISGRTGMGSILAPFLTMLASRTLAGEIVPSVEVCDAVLDLLAVTCRSADGGPAVDFPDAAHQAFLLRVQTYIEERLGDRTLDSASIAAAHHVSVRYLQKLFKAYGITVNSWVRSRRLDRCRRDLLDPQLRHIPIAAIGSRWGYEDAANFARAFRLEFHAAPSEVRLKLGSQLVVQANESTQRGAARFG